jgi:hypothetical protein
VVGSRTSGQTTISSIFQGIFGISGNAGAIMSPAGLQIEGIVE